MEFDGPGHFFVCGAPSGATVMKRRHMELLGHSLVSIVFADWYGRDAAGNEEYLRQRLSLAQTSSASFTATSSADTTTTTLPPCRPPSSIATASAVLTLPPCLPTPSTAASSAATTTTTLQPHSASLPSHQQNQTGRKMARAARTPTRTRRMPVRNVV